jgi:hypothetical protein
MCRGMLYIREMVHIQSIRLDRVAVCKDLRIEDLSIKLNLLPLIQ